ncbi:beta-1,3-galactosyl-O-glycosyl-glycoprotein beta-1,6-N-acetylglucosaminyltransferase [Latimeria chalumnae]|nr:PREDICTED: beta-1,3-galactosyl-O-glycosyl-glycoprotein beta-1,6-N-acetylglucosaminyltransferase [Latimeria chalumnae]|eukprot:XP_006009164.1 PREDICTED: beta-1,3-galactosyl-O-glycosyl-glycoprotein beta-1,6-N-acetylglucosaminyltransferase [Latimeria chalumnae]
MRLRRLRCFTTNRNKVLGVGLTFLTTFSFVLIRMKEDSLSYSHLELTEKSPEHPINCTLIINGDEEEIQKSKIMTISVDFKKRPQLTANDYIEMTKDCQDFTKMRKYITEPLSKEESEFPIAYSMVTHKSIELFERLLRSVYAPQNYYCIHVDKKSPESFLAAVQGIASCFENVFIASQLESVVYASWSRVQADLNCMKDLYRKSVTWKYLINLCGMDFPIKTNFEIVEKLKALKGENSLETEKMPANKERRWKTHYEIIDGHIKNMEVSKSPPPIKTQIFSGSAYFVVSRKFVEHILEDSKILEFIEWAKDTYSPDEFLWATLQRIPGVPGFVPANGKFDVSDMNALARLVKWYYHEGDVSDGAPYPPCRGVHVRSICVFGAGDLKWMLKKHHLFANKFDTDVDVFAIQCLEEHLRHKALYRPRV